MPPAVLQVDGIEALEEEVFGPVLHVAAYDADRIDAVVDYVLERHVCVDTTAADGNASLLANAEA